MVGYDKPEPPPSKYNLLCLQACVICSFHGSLLFYAISLAEFKDRIGLISQMEMEKGYTFVCSDIPKRSFDFFKDMRNKRELCDVTFQVGNESISAHRIVITAVIPYFRDILLGEDAQSGEEGVSMADIEPNALKGLIEFAYSCKVEINKENVMSLLSAACYLQVDEVRVACCDFLADGLKPENVLNIRKLACTLNCSELLDFIDCYIKEHFVQISKTEDFLEYPVNLLKELICKDDLHVNNEEQVFEAIVNWVKESPEDRKTELPELLRSVRMSVLQPLYLATIAEREEVIRTSILCRDLLDEARNYNSFPQARKSICSFPTEPRLSMKTSTLTLDNDRGRIYKLYHQFHFVVQRFDLEKQKWLTNEIRIFRENCGSTTELRNKMYYFIYGHALQYDPVNNEYSFLAAVPTPRIFAGASCLKNEIYLCGGKIGKTPTSAVECFDPVKNKWTSVSYMRTACWGPCVLALGEYLYVLGGCDGTSVFNSVVRYDPVMDKWRAVSSMLTRRCFSGAATLNGKIYICGGRTLLDNTQGIASAEVYDPVENEWKFISPMNSVRHLFTLLSCCGKLYVLGGEGDHKKYQHSFDIYDPESDQWTSGLPTDTTHPTSGAVVMSVDNH